MQQWWNYGKGHAFGRILLQRDITKHSYYLRVPKVLCLFMEWYILTYKTISWSYQMDSTTLGLTIGLLMNCLKIKLMTLQKLSYMVKYSILLNKMVGRNERDDL